EKVVGHHPHSLWQVDCFSHFSHMAASSSITDRPHENSLNIRKEILRGLQYHNTE
ncbi:hypothetical protein KI387_034021, partial [Taxus chinensis]